MIPNIIRIVLLVGFTFGYKSSDVIFSSLWDLTKSKEKNLYDLNLLMKSIGLHNVLDKGTRLEICVFANLNDLPGFDTDDYLFESNISIKYNIMDPIFSNKSITWNKVYCLAKIANDYYEIQKNTVVFFLSEGVITTSQFQLSTTIDYLFQAQEAKNIFRCKYGNKFGIHFDEDVMAMHASLGPTLENALYNSLLFQEFSNLKNILITFLFSYAYQSSIFYLDPAHTE